MRILLANKFLHPVGGAESVFFAEWEALEAGGHEVIPFGMASPDAVDSPYSRYWLPEQDYARPAPGQVAALIWSREAAARLEALLKETRPDVAHLHNIYHQLSPSILPALKRQNVPVVMTVHDYKPVCPNYRLYTHGELCTRCVASHPWHALRHRCHKDSYAASAVVALEAAVHRARGTYDLVDLFIAPSRFVRNVLAGGGFGTSRIRVLPHAVTVPDTLPDAEPPAAPGYFLFAARLEAVKGVRPLMAAAESTPEVRFLIAGEGPEKAAMEARSLANVRFAGKLSRLQLDGARRHARAELAPSLWYEVFGMSALEGMAAGLPVIASAIGALEELVTHEETGLLAPPGNAAALAMCVRRLQADPDLARRLGRAARRHVEMQHDPEAHLKALEKILEEAIGESS